jgi:hypothetical protein
VGVMTGLIKPFVAVAFAITFAGGTTTVKPQFNVDYTRVVALIDFGRSMNEYAAVHRRLAAALPPLVAASDLNEIAATRASLALAIKRARPNARQGDIFTPAVGQLFRDLIETALEGRDVEALLTALFEDLPVVEDTRVGVYDRYPDWATHEMPIVLLHRLPLLPGEVEYRVIDHNLILWDVDADLVLDVLVEAIPRPTS